MQDRLEADESCLRLEKVDRLEIFQVFLFNFFFLKYIKKKKKESFHFIKLFVMSQEYIHDLEKDEEEQRKLRVV